MYILLGSLLALIIINTITTKEDLRKIIIPIVAALTIELVVSLFEVFTTFRYPISPYSAKASIFGRQGADIFATAATGFQWNPNNLAVLMIIVLPFTLVSKRLSFKIVYSLVVLIIILYSESRGVFLGLLLLVFLFILFIKNLKIKMLSIILLGLTVVFLPSLLDELSESENYNVRRLASSLNAVQMFVSDDVANQQSSVGVRRALTDNALERLKETKGRGVGAGNIKVIEIGEHQIFSLHNFWLEILTEGGILFSMFFMLWYGSILRQLFQVYSKTIGVIQRFSKALFVSSIVFIPSAVSASSVIYFLPMWILIGLSISTINLYKKGAIK